MSLGSIVAALLVLLLVAGFVGNLTLSRRRSRGGMSIERLLEARLAVRDEHPAGGDHQGGDRATEGDRGGTDVWRSLERAVAATPSAPTADGLWERLAFLIDPAEYRPQLAPDIEVKRFRLRWGNDYAVAANLRDLIHLRLEPTEVDLLPLMDGTRTLKEIVLDRFEESGDLELAGLADLVTELREGNFLVTRYLDAEAAVTEALDPSSTAAKKARGFMKTLSIEWGGADRLVRWFYDHGFRHVFDRPVLLATAVVTIAGVASFVALYRSGRFELSATSAASATLILLGLDYVLTFAHELGHVLVLTHHGRHIKEAGFLIYFGSPAFFVDASDGLMLDRRTRIAQSFAGPYAEMILAGIASIYVWAFPDSPGASVIYTFALLNYFVIFLNLIPLLELDGYWILSDLIQVPDLRARSLSFMRDDLARKLLKRERFTKQEVGLALYGTLGTAFAVLSLVTGAFFWKQVFGGLVSDLWNGGWVTRALLLALALFVTGPLLRAGIALGRSLFRRARAIVRRIRFRFQMRWRIEAAELIDALPIFEDLPPEVLSDLAGRVRLRSFPRGKPLVRQGQRATAFFVVRSGTLQVVEQPPGKDDRVLRTLGRGEAFGELGLVEGSPRSATVRALEQAEVFEIDKGTFERLLADMAHVPEFEPTVQAIVELGEIPVFAAMEHDELQELVRHGSWMSFSPGKEIFQQGEPGDAFYALRSGRVDVVQDGSLVRTLGPGSYFGEVALLMDVPRTATVLAHTPVRAFRIDREGFDRVVARAFGRGTLKPHAGAGRTWEH